ncbi:MAG: cellulose synthase/poly-beta-1,6-N-acetylglucosamine synthase-like glycosyltransferase [Granulosicoccus sp.]|jgi:cellulose synthase/poly-beta-1,6-N-acetylglucosamine synthase-like glycosyltransferase
MSIIIYFYIFVSALLAFYLLFPFVTVFLALFSREKIKTKEELGDAYQEYDYGCIITAYKNAEIAKPLIASLLKQPFPKFHIYLVADDCDISDFKLTDKKLMVLNPQPSLKLKAKSIIHAMDNYVRKHDYTVVFDADNLAHPDFLLEINKYANNGYQAIQGQRTAKNLDTIYACADATGEFYKNYIERYVPYMLGSSTVISGSGMAVETELYSAYLASPEIEIGKTQWKKMLQEDKILQNNLLYQDEKIVYAKNAIVFDEKVVSGAQVETQRSRWLFSYFQNLPNSSGLILKGLTRLSWNQFFFGLITIAPPLFILLFISMVWAVVGLFIAPKIGLGLIASLVIFSCTILWTLYLSKAPKEVWSAIWGLPFFVLKQVTALFKMGNPDKNFKHSEHTRNIPIDDVLKKDK